MLVVSQVERASFWPWDIETSVLTSSIDTGLAQSVKGRQITAAIGKVPSSWSALLFPCRRHSEPSCASPS